jgi:hypothetical protein
MKKHAQIRVTSIHAAYNTALLFCLFVALPLHAANQAVTITVSANPERIHTYEGLGASTNDFGGYSRLPEETRRDMSNLLFGLPGFRYLRLWGLSNLNDNSYTFYKGNHLQYADAKKARANLGNDTILVLFGPAGKIGDLRSYASYYAQQIKDLDSLYTMRVDVTGIANEPNNNDNLKAEQVPVLVRYFREELDKRGLQHIKIIAPETSNLDHIAWQMTEAIVADPGAMDVLYGFSTHSYNMCVTNDYARYVAATGKKYWQTESSENGPEGYTDSIRAVQALHRVISDINLGVNVWFFFFAYWGFWDQDNAINIIVWHNETGEYNVLLKYFYFRQFCHTFDAGAQMRLCTSNLPVRSSGSHADVYMENTYGLKPPLCACGGQNPGGDWSFALTNMTGVFSSWAGSQYYPYASYDVTFFVEELEAAAPHNYCVMKCNNGTRNVIIDTVTMKNGRFTVTISPMDMLSIRQNFVTDYYPIKEFKQADDYGPCGMGVGFAFIPPLGLSAFSLLRRFKKRKRRRK